MEIFKITYRTTTYDSSIRDNNEKPLNFLLGGAVADKKKKGMIKPGSIQVQAAIYLGCNRISCFAYSNQVKASEPDLLDGVKLKFEKHLTEGLKINSDFATEVLIDE